MFSLRFSLRLSLRLCVSAGKTHSRIATKGVPYIERDRTELSTMGKE
jgi:hypothetical protein